MLLLLLAAMTQYMLLPYNDVVLMDAATLLALS